MNEKIMIALADISLASLLSKVLSEQGYVVSCVKNGQEALDGMRIQKPDLLLIDPELPGMNGYAVLSEKSLDRTLTKIPVIVISSSGSPLEMHLIPSTSSTKDFIVKTHIEPSEVLTKVASVFGRIFDPASISQDMDQKKPVVVPSKKILWVEDDKFLSMILLKKFQSSGHTVLKATTAEEAFALLEKEVPDIIILDVLLPGMNGFDILQKIKMSDKSKNIPVIILSNLSKSADIEKARMLGAQKFLVKAAVSLEEIVSAVNTLTN